MSTTIPVELNGNEYISEVVSSKNGDNEVEYFIKINGDPACFVNFKQVDLIFQEESSSPDLTPEFKEAVKNALLNYMATSTIN